jgi:hypothetical protein
VTSIKSSIDFWEQDQPVIEVLLAIACLILFGCISRITLIKGYKEFQITHIYDGAIKRTMLLAFSSETLEKSNVKGFSTATLKYKNYSIRAIVIYLNDKRKIQITPFSHLNFSKLESALTDAGYKYLGTECRIPGLWFESKYKFDDGSIPE